MADLCIWLHPLTNHPLLCTPPVHQSQVLEVPGKKLDNNKWLPVVEAMDKMVLEGPMWEDDAHKRRRGIIFTPSVKRCDEVYYTLDLAIAFSEGGASFEVVKYHSRMPEAEKLQSFQRFTSTAEDAEGLIVMVATTAAGVSLDHDRVRWTIHDGGIYGDSNMVQETGRGGRDGKPALALLLVDESTIDWMFKIEAEAYRSHDASLLHDHYPVSKAASIAHARMALQSGVAGSKYHESVCLCACCRRRM